MKTNYNLERFLKKASFLKTNYKNFLINKKNLQYSLHSFQRKRQDYFFFKKSLKNILQFLFKKGEKKKVYNLVKKVFIFNKITKNSNYILYKNLYKIIFSNTPYMNFLDLPPKNSRRLKKSRKNKNKTLFLVPILPRVQKRIQANWFLKSIKQKNQNLTQNFLNEILKSYKNKEWMLKESKDFYESAMDSFLRFGRKSIKLYKKSKSNKFKTKNLYKKQTSYSKLLLNNKKKNKNNLKDLNQNKFKGFNNDFKEVKTFTVKDLLPVKNINVLKLKKKKIKKKFNANRKKISLNYYKILKKNNLDNFFDKKTQNFNKFNKLNKTLYKNEILNELNSKKKILKKFYLENSLKNLNQLKQLNLYRPFNLHLISKDINLKKILKYNEIYNEYSIKQFNLKLNKKIETNNLLKKLNQKENHSLNEKKIFLKSLKWFTI